MAEPATKPMTLDEFLHWDDGTETRYELIAGFPVAMPVSLEAQRILISRLAGRIEATLSRHASATTLVGVGVVPPDERETFLVADIAATRALIDPWRQTIEEPFLIIEVLAPNTERHDWRVKLPAYRQIDTVEELVLIASDGVHAELHRRSGAQWFTEILRGGDAVLALTSVGIEVQLGQLYEGIALPDAE
jgi:Uma2 family endonuclease